MRTGCGWEIMVDHKFCRGRGRCQLSLERTAADSRVSASTVRAGFRPTWETLCYPYILTGPGREPRSWVLGHSDIDIVPLFGYTFRQLQANEPSASVRRSQGRQAVPLEMRLASFAGDALA